MFQVTSCQVIRLLFLIGSDRRHHSQSVRTVLNEFFETRTLLFCCEFKPVQMFLQLENSFLRSPAADLLVFFINDQVLNQQGQTCWTEHGVTLKHETC